MTEHDCLLLQHVMWSRPEDCEKIYDWLLSNMSVDSEMRQSNYLLASLFGRTCHSLQVCPPLFVPSPVFSGPATAQVSISARSAC